MVYFFNYGIYVMGMVSDFYVYFNNFESFCLGFNDFVLIKLYFDLWLVSGFSLSVFIFVRLKMNEFLLV